MTEENTTPEAQGDNSVQTGDDVNKQDNKGKSANYIKSLQEKLEAKDEEKAQLEQQLAQMAEQVYEKREFEKQQEAIKIQQLEDVRKVESSLGKEVAELVQKEIDENPTLSVEKALRIVSPDQFVWWEAFNLQGAVPKSVTNPDAKPKTTNELKQQLQKDIAEWKVVF